MVDVLKGPRGMPFGLSNNLMQRIVSAVLLLPFVLWPIYAGGWWFAWLLAVGGSLMMLEWCRLTHLTSLVTPVVAAFMLILLVFWLEYTGEGLGYPVLVGLVALSVLGVMTAWVNPDLGWLLSGFGYVGMALIALLLLRGLDAWLVLWVFLVVWATDVGGYFAGKGIGGPKLAPSISPKKTWAGLLGGMGLSALVTYLMVLWLGFGKEGTLLVLLSAFLAIWAQVGDLAESALKRHFNVKDSGGLIPGHGGLLDRVDGLVFAAPAVVLIAYVRPSIWF